MVLSIKNTIERLSWIGYKIAYRFPVGFAAQVKISSEFHCFTSILVSAVHCITERL